MRMPRRAFRPPECALRATLRHSAILGTPSTLAPHEAEREYTTEGF
jgi:hypothetical protein